MLITQDKFYENSNIIYLVKCISLPLLLLQKHKRENIYGDAKSCIALLKQMRSVILKIHLHMQRHRCACYCITELTLTVTRTTGTSSVNCIGLCTLSTLVNDTFIELQEDHFQIYIYIYTFDAQSCIFMDIYTYIYI